MTAEYLFEVRFSEMPRTLVEKSLKQLSTRLFEDLMGRGMGPGEVVTGMTPRRLVVCLLDLPAVEPEREERHLGPSVADAYGDDGEPSAILRRFLKREGLSLRDLRQIKTERGAHVGVVRELAGRPLKEILGDIVPCALGEIAWWPPMGAGGGPHSVLSLLDGEVIPLELSGVAAGAATAGHPVLSPEPIEVSSFAEYQDALRSLGIEVIVAARRQGLANALEQRAAELRGKLETDPELLDRLTASCEIPGIVRGAFDPSHLDLPEEILSTVLSDRLSAFALRRENELLPCFLTVMDRADDPEMRVAAGQERAAAGRLIDARFRYDADRRLTLAERRRLLEELDFHPLLGSYGAKVDRIRALVELACSQLGWEDVVTPACEAAELLKADLTCGLVRDYPSLRGTIGGIYAREEGYVEAVWLAIFEHYRSRPIPRRRSGRVLAVADRLDSLVGFFGIGEIASGSRDPYGLRRRAQGLLRIVVDAGMELDLDLMTARAVLLYGDRLKRSAESILGTLQAFLGARFRHLMGRRGFAYDEIEAAEAIGVKNLPDLVARLEALKTVRETPDFRSLVRAAKRIFNIVRDSPEFELRPSELAEGAERDLHDVLTEVRKRVDLSAQERRYEDGLRSMAELVPHLDRFFADVLVMDDNERLRTNRIALLQACRRVFWRIARLQQMVADRSQPIDGPRFS